MDNPKRKQAGQPSGALEERAHARSSGALSASPRIVTTGGNPPTQGIDEHTPVTQAHIDWFAFTVTPPEGETPAWLIQSLLRFLPIQALTPTGKGWNGYKERHNITGRDGADLGLLAFGGASQRHALASHR